MNTACDFAKYFMSKGLDESPNTYDGNMKLQKLLVFAYLIGLAKYGKPLFNDAIIAFTKGYVVDSVRQRYQYNYSSLKAESDAFIPDFSDEEQDIINNTIEIYGDLSAKTLSDLSHEFDFWSESYNRGLNSNGFHDKERSTIAPDSILKEIDAIRKVLTAHEQIKKLDSSFQCINGIKFFYTPSEIEMDDTLISKLYDFSQDADELSYSVYYDEGELVVY